MLKVDDESHASNIIQALINSREVDDVDIEELLLKQEERNATELNNEDVDNQELEITMETYANIGTTRSL